MSNEISTNSEHGERATAGAAGSCGGRAVSYFMEFIGFNKGRVMIWLGDIPRLPARRCNGGGGARARLYYGCSRNIAVSSVTYNRPIKTQSIRRMELFTRKRNLIKFRCLTRVCRYAVRTAGASKTLQSHIYLFRLVNIFQ